MIQTKYDTIIWDWNGTLLNDVDLCLSIANKMLANHQPNPLDLASYRNAFGFPITAYYEKIGIDLEKESFEALTEKFLRNFNQGLKNCNLHENVLPILKQFSFSPGLKIIPSIISVSGFVNAIKYLTSKVVIFNSLLMISSVSGVNLPKSTVCVSCTLTSNN
ncbi:MAG: HAD family hydrolase [Saprospiraceae bacterium]